MIAVARNSSIDVMERQSEEGQIECYDWLLSRRADGGKSLLPALAQNSLLPNSTLPPSQKFIPTAIATQPRKSISLPVKLRESIQYYSSIILAVEITNSTSFWWSTLVLFC